MASEKPAGIKKYTLNVDVLEQQFEKLYGECPRVNCELHTDKLMVQ
uniref:40S ribosomal protein S7 n=1 Tax=Heterorhabditis bacteriophora TaxID=37862 RepID=A0A1I7X0D4_HETBA